MAGASIDGCELASIDWVSGGGTIGGEVDGGSGTSTATYVRAGVVANAELAVAVESPSPELTGAVEGGGVVATTRDRFEGETINWVGGGGAIGGEVDGDSGTSAAATCIRAGIVADAELAVSVMPPDPNIISEINGEATVFTARDRFEGETINWVGGGGAIGGEVDGDERTSIDAT